ncbi:MAG TPA: stage II sporulation protein M [Gemmatimonadales bacterium]|nr:stage II sporulation protein M [Gemmatimonadales bacterium]
MTAATRDPSHPGTGDLRTQLDVETPEQVEVRFELAGLGSRVAALTIDLLVLFVGSVVLVIVLALFSSDTGKSKSSDVPGTWVAAFLYILYSFAMLLYFTLFEGLGGGRTPGKRALGIRVLMDTGRRVTFGAAALRNILRIVDFFFPFAPILPGMLFVFLSKSRKRLGDLAAGTIVVRDRPTDWTPLAISRKPEEPAELEIGPPELSEEEFRLLDRFIARAQDLAPAALSKMTGDLLERFQQWIPRSPDGMTGLTMLLELERSRRRGKFSTRARAGMVGRVAVTGERFVERRRDRWEAFRSVALRIEQQGVRGLPADEIPGFAARYREVAADLARARTYGVDPQVIEYLERLVSAGHNALYRWRGKDRTPWWRYLSRDFPAAVLQSWRYVLVSFLLFMVPAVSGYALLRARPDLADDLANPVLVNRAQEAADREARGIGYAQSPDQELPVIAAAIITNNINVCFMAFAGGLALGLWTIVSLTFNGFELGMGFGVFANYHAAGYLGTFIAGHGVLELTAIFISGGAGLRLGHALIAPGDRTRRDALVVDGLIAAKMIGMVIVLLCIAGTIEGLLSASDAPAVFKFLVSGTSAVFLGLYLANGWRHRVEAGQRSQPGRSAIA